MSQADQLSDELRRQCQAFEELQDSEEREEALTAITESVGRLLQDDEHIPAREQARQQQLAQAALARTDRAVYSAAGVCALGGLAVIATVIWGSTSGFAVLGGVAAVLLALSLVLMASVDQLHTSEGVCVPDPGRRWLASGSAVLAVAALAAVAWGWIGALGVTVLLVAGAAAFKLAWSDIAQAPSNSPQRSS